MMDMRYDIRRQQHQDLLREAEAYRLARELGVTDGGRLRSIATRLRVWLSQIRPPKVPGSDGALTRRTRKEAR